MLLTDLIEKFIKDLINEEDGEVVIQRNELANHFGCVPSQISYVLRSRFSNDRGYIVESRRGGGGSVVIKKVNITAPSYLMHIVSVIGDMISRADAACFIQNCLDYDAITKNEAKIMAAAISDTVLGNINQPYRDKIRAQILKNMVVNLI